MENDRSLKTPAEKREEFILRRDRLTTMGGEAMVREQKAQGKRTVRERIDYLLIREPSRRSSSS